MPYTEKQKKVGCAIAHGAKLDKVKMSQKVAKDMCDSPVKKKSKKHG